MKNYDDGNEISDWCGITSCMWWIATFTFETDVETLCKYCLQFFWIMKLDWRFVGTDSGRYVRPTLSGIVRSRAELVGVGVDGSLTCSESGNGGAGDGSLSVILRNKCLSTTFKCKVKEKKIKINEMLCLESERLRPNPNPVDSGQFWSIPVNSSRLRFRLTSSPGDFHSKRRVSPYYGGTVQMRLEAMRTFY